MIDPTMLAAATGVIGATLAAIWSFLMAAKVAAPRAAKKSKLLLVNILTGATPEDQAILGTIQEKLIRPEVERMSAAMPKLDEEALAIDYDEIAEAVGPIVTKHMEMAFRQVEAQQAKRTQQFLNEMGVDDKLKDLEGAAREQAMAQMGIEGQIAMEILEMKVNKKASVVEKLVLQKAKLEAAKMIQGSMGAEETIIQPASVGRSGIGVR